MIEMSPENAQFIDQIVAAGRFDSRHEAIDEAVQLLRGEIGQRDQRATDSLTARDWCERFDSWAASHRDLPHAADDSREGIYSDRGA